jgi:hypothetical protein
MSPPRMRSNAVGGGDCTLSLAGDGAVMMPLQYLSTRMSVPSSELEPGGGEHNSLASEGTGGVSLDD